MAVERGQALARGMTLLLLLLFSVFVLLTAAYGVRMYRSLQSDADANYALRAGMAYVSGKVRALDAKNSVFVERIGETDVLILSEEIEGMVYNTYIYLHQGRLCELYADADFAFDPEAGLPLVELHRFSFYLEGDALCLTVTAPTGEVRSGRTLLRSGGGGT